MAFPQQYMTLFCRVISLAGAVNCVLPSQALAHPHVFIDTKVTAFLDSDGQLVSIRLRWDYDEMLSMVVVEDKGADVNLDGRISSAEEAVLDGFDMTWTEGFDGDTSLIQSNEILGLEPGPNDWVTGWSADDGGGHLWSEHSRKILVPVDPHAGPISVVVYDVADYTSYTLTSSVFVTSEHQKDTVPPECRIGPPTSGASETDAGLFTTLGLLIFGSDYGSDDTTGVPTPASGRVILVISCD